MDARLKRFIDHEIERGLGPGFDPTVPSQIDAAFIGCEREGITPMFLEYAKERKWSLSTHHHSWWRDHVARIVLYRKLSEEVTKLSIPCVILKGEPLAMWLFHDSFLRTVTDLDILVAPNDVHRTIEELRALGWRRVQDHLVRPWAYNQVALRHKDHGAILELHWRLALPNLPSPSTVSVIANAENHAMQYKHQALHLAHHYFQHHGFVKGLFDLAGMTLWLSTPNAAAALHDAKQLGIGAIYSAPFLLLRELGFENVVSIVDNRLSRQLAKRFKRKQGHLVQAGTSSTLRDFSSSVGLTRFLDRPRDRVRASARPIFFGPHRLGTFLGSRFGREWW